MFKEMQLLGMTPGYHSCYRKSSCENAPLEFHLSSVEFRNKSQWNLVPSEKKTKNSCVVVLYVCMYVFMYVYMYVCMYVYVCIHVCV